MLILNMRVKKEMKKSELRKWDQENRLQGGKRNETSKSMVFKKDDAQSRIYKSSAPIFIPAVTESHIGEPSVSHITRHFCNYISYLGNTSSRDQELPI